ncbi:group II intron reverse transcriptase [Limnospira platensis]|uniref:group II intron reverse transcriptase n=1 Tax=Limnospira platensis TaxID=118562 RepID=UPI0001D0EC6D|nr:DNA polymerase [Arthrospira platensis str. Paraca]MDF2208652.1 RNA-dependent DNA polymerase [Arthrospira platensis NCB002]QQW29113.1 RNA-dependent DNA polymerase [Arthrospira sp. PCC 9108]BAI94168.1 reverse transcriptase homolog [Arthrospira platensis NIES-39]BDT16363.1 reverse transcriptase homolog [Arthrospira platensis NIES-39]
MKKAGIGIPTIQDRARQALVKSALEPEWESRFESTSYGFRPGRSAQDAIARIYSSINKGEYYVLDADIAKCFDRINHDYLLSKIHCPSCLKRDLKQWLKAGVLDNGVFEDTESGTPQGGVISPLLANIALDGMIRFIETMYPKKANRAQATVIRYADDFVVISPSLEIIEQCKTAISERLKPVVLEIKPEKTRICHTFKPIEYEGRTEEPGFDFLGFNIRQYPAGKYKSGKTGGMASRLIGHKTHIKPSQKAVAHTEVIKGVIKQFKTAPQSTLINKLNPIIMGWSNYYSGVVSTETFTKLDKTIWQMLRAWTVSRCGKASHEKLRNYFRHGTIKLSNGKERHENWLFQTKDGLHLFKHNWTPIVRHTLRRPDATLYDGNWTYWASRKGRAIDTPNRVAKLLKKQKGRCTWCGQFFTPSDLIEIDHIVPRSQGGKDDYKNIQLLHRHCHDDKTALDEEMMLYS